jgi:hypothetical protein
MTDHTYSEMTQDLFKSLGIDPSAVKKLQPPAEKSNDGAPVIPNDVGVVIGEAKPKPKYDVNDPNLNVVDIEDLVKKLERNDPSVDSVNLNSHVTSTGDGPSDENLIRVCKALEKNRYVLDLSMSGCGMGDDAALAVAKMLSRNDTLKASFSSTHDVESNVFIFVRPLRA